VIDPAISQWQLLICSNSAYELKHQDSAYELKHQEMAFDALTLWQAESFANAESIARPSR
jgi:hypothetical protein